MSRTHIVLSLALAACLSNPLLLRAQTPAGTQPATQPADEQAVRNAQLRLLEMQQLAVRSDQPEAHQLRIDEAVRQWLASGIPAEALSPQALHTAAINRTARMVMLAPPRNGPRLLADARRRYGVDPAEVLSRIPSPMVDVTDLLRQATDEKDPDLRMILRQRLQEIHPTPAVIETAIRFAGQDPSPNALNAALTILESDWSERGLNFLIDRLLFENDPMTQVRLLRILRNRYQMQSQTFADLADRTASDDVRREIFESAQILLALGNPEARTFLQQQLASSQSHNRTRAMQILARDPGTLSRDLDRLIAVVDAEKDPAVRAEMIRHLGRHAGPVNPRLSDRIYQWLETDPAEEVRIAALDCIRFDPQPATPELDRQRQQQVDRLRKALGDNPPANLQRAFDQKLQLLERQQQRARQIAAQREKRAQELQEQLQTQPAPQTQLAPPAPATD